MKARLVTLTALVLFAVPAIAQAGALSEVWWLWLVRWFTMSSGGWYGY